MAEYIERSRIKYEQWSVGPLNGPLMVVRKKTIDSIPAADVEPVRHGRWEFVEQRFYRGEFVNLFRCSECKVATDTNSTYCPNCGARMDGET